jgi:hypothetical protein
MDDGRPVRLEIITPSYAPDVELCADLVASVRRHGPAGVRHRILVPRRDLPLFRRFADGERTVVDAVDTVLPRGLVRVPGQNMWVNLRAPWPPVRGWIAQQLVKLAATAESRADAVLLVDSDTVFVRPFSAADYLDAGGAPLYRLVDAIDGRLPRHLVWDKVARALLGLPSDLRESAHDYICWPCVWEPSIARTLLARVASQTRMPWATAIGRELHFSEMVLYGVYVDEVIGASRPIVHTDGMRCVSYSHEDTLDEADLRRFLDGVGADDLAVMISAKSGTSLDLRRRVLAEYFG